MPNYKQGTADPPLNHDKGAGDWNSTPTEIATHVKKAAILQALPLAIAYPGFDAVKHMYHYFGNSGADYTINLEGMVTSVPSAIANLANEIELAKRFIETLPAGHYEFTSEKATAGYNRQSESSNWYFAIGGYTYWGKGLATVSYTPDFLKAYQMIFHFKFFDRYNWDGGKKVTLAGVEITDEWMGEFHRQGVAKEFNCYGSVERAVSWGAPMPVTPAPVGPITPPPPLPPPPPPVSPAPPKPPVPPIKPVPPKPPIPPVTPKPPVPPGPPPSQVYVVKPGDNLSAISAKFYGTPAKWTTIYAKNKGVIGSNPNLIHPGQHLLIP